MELPSLNVLSPCLPGYIYNGFPFTSKASNLTLEPFVKKELPSNKKAFLPPVSVLSNSVTLK